MGISGSPPLLFRVASQPICRNLSSCCQMSVMERYKSAGAGFRDIHMVGLGSWRTNRGGRKEHREVRSQQSSRKEEVLLG